MLEIIKSILVGDNLRASLSDLRNEFKEEKQLDRTCWNEILKGAGAKESEVIAAIMSALENDDAKTRKNAALLLGDYKEIIGFDEKVSSEITEKIWATYMQDDTRFVKSSYIKALGKFDCLAYVENIHEEIKRLQAKELGEEEVKHTRELRVELSKIIENYESERPVKILKPIKKKHVILVEAEDYIRKDLARYISEVLGDKVSIVPRGVRVVTDNVMKISKMPIYREVWFLIRFRQEASSELDELSRSLADSELIPLLAEAYGKEKEYTFKLENTDDVLSKNTKIVGMAIEEETKYRLKNVTSNPDIYLRIYSKKDKGFAVYGRLPDLGKDRFDYMCENLPTSMSPIVAGQMNELISGYTRDDAQVIDPFCGTGALLIARCKRKNAQYVYGVDKYGEAIDIARKNAEAAGENIYFVNRDYFDFTSEYMMDEIITEFPRMENKSKKEVDEFYKKFIDKSVEITEKGAMMFLLSTEQDVIKKQVRLNKAIELVRTIPMRGREQIYILKRRG